MIAEELKEDTENRINQILNDVGTLDQQVRIAQDALERIPIIEDRQAQLAENIDIIRRLVKVKDIEMDDPLLWAHWPGDPGSARGLSLESVRSYEEIEFDNPTYLYGGSGEVWAGVLWRVRETLGKSAADTAICGAWIETEVPDPSHHDEVARAFIDEIIELSGGGSDGAVRDEIRSIFEERDFPIDAR